MSDVWSPRQSSNGESPGILLPSSPSTEGESLAWLSVLMLRQQAGLVAAARAMRVVEILIAMSLSFQACVYAKTDEVGIDKGKGAGEEGH